MGTVQLPNFERYEVQYGIGQNPQGWRWISGPHMAQVRDGLLAEWETAHLAPGPYTLRITAFSSGQGSMEARVQVIVAAPTDTPAPTEPPSPTPEATSTPVSTLTPTLAPTVEPTAEPTLEPTPAPTVAPPIKPTVTPTIAPTVEITATLPITPSGDALVILTFTPTP
jgi:hypothetical protein